MNPVQEEGDMLVGPSELSRFLGVFEQLVHTSQAYPIELSSLLIIGPAALVCFVLSVPSVHGSAASESVACLAGEPSQRRSSRPSRQLTRSAVEPAQVGFRYSRARPRAIQGDGAWHGIGC